MTFKKGQSGNPGGRPKQYAEVVGAARAHTKAAIKKLAHLMDKAANESLQAYCADKLLNRGWGNPPSSMLHAAAEELPGSSAYKAFLKSIDGESRKLPDGNDPNEDDDKGEDGEK